MLDQIRSLEEENQKYLDKIIKTSKETAQLYEKQRDPGALAEVSRNVMSKNAPTDAQDKTVNSYLITSR